MDEREHPIQQRIQEVEVWKGYDWKVGRDGVTRIEPCTKSGMHANIPYIRVWKGEDCVAEFCQHNIVGIYFAEREASDGQA